VLVLALMGHGGGAQAAGGERSEEYVAPSKFELRIPEGPVPQIRSNLIQIHSSDHGIGTFQEFADYCLATNGAVLQEEDFEKKFKAWSVEDTGGAVLYSEEPVFDVLGWVFLEGDEPVTYHTEPAHYTALILCFFKTFFPDHILPELDDERATFKVIMTGAPNGEVVIIPEMTTINGSIFMLKAAYHKFKRGLKIQITPSKTGRTTILLGGRLGTFPHFPLPLSSNR